MAKVKSYGSITIIDITDIGEFSVYPVCNLPASVIYDPDQKSYTPDWSSSQLELEPVVYYAGKQLDLSTTTGLTIKWLRREGTGGATETLNSGESVQDGKLIVSKNQFTPSSSMLTYIVQASYVEPSSQQNLTAQGQMSFSMIKMASAIKNCYITGNNIFKYKGDGSIVGDSAITLTATLNNVEISEWQYKDSSGAWAKYPNSTKAVTLTVDESDNVFTNDMVTIRLMSNDADTYDIFTITKLRDGAAGTDNISAVLTNEDQMVPVTSTTADYSQAKSQIIIYDGGEVDTANWNITVTTSNVTVTKSKTVTDNDTVQVTKIADNADSGTVTFTCKDKAGEHSDIIKTFSVVKVKSGADGKSPTVYELESSVYAVNKSIGGTLTPATITFNGYSTVDSTRSLYKGRFKVFENVAYENIGSATAKYTSSSDESSMTYTPSSSATSILCVLYASGGTTSVKDYQSVVITNDGKTGEQGKQGAAGKDSINVIIGNEADVIPCTNANATSAAITITIPFSGYKGITKVAVTCNNVATNTKLFGVTPTITNATATADGSIKWVVNAGTSVGSASGTIDLSFTCEGQNVAKTYRWTRSTAAKDGVNAVLFQLYTPSGNVFSESLTTLTIKGQIYDGATDKTSSGSSWAWAKYDVASSSYKTVTGSTSTLSVTRDTVDSYASYRCTVEYNNVTYTAYYSLIDKTDPIQVTVLSSIGTQIVNGQGYGAIYCKVTRNGQEIDSIKSERFLTAAPASPTSGDYYYLVNKTAKTVTLKQYDGSKWNDADPGYTGTYKWAYRNSDGNTITSTSLPSTGKVIYIDGSLVDNKIICDVEVEI